MITQMNNSAVQAAYQSKVGEQRAPKQQGVTLNKQSETSKLDQLKESIDSGEYKVDIQALSQKMAESLL